MFGAIRSETGTSDNPRKFTGKEFDADSNLYYYGLGSAGLLQVKVVRCIIQMIIMKHLLH